MNRETRPALPWLLVVAHGQRQLMTELEALFRGDRRIRVIEDRRTARGLLPRLDSVRPLPLTPSPR